MENIFTCLLGINDLVESTNTKIGDPLHKKLNAIVGGVETIISCMTVEARKHELARSGHDPGKFCIKSVFWREWLKRARIIDT